MSDVSNSRTQISIYCKGEGVRMLGIGIAGRFGFRLIRTENKSDGGFG
jgi:hypothetical protein